MSLRRTGAALAAMALLAACAQGPSGRFPLAPPVERDPDLEPAVNGCRKNEKGKTECGPEAYASSFAWDAADNTVFRPLAQFFAVKPGAEARDVNAMDEVPDSSWFENRIGRRPMSVAELSHGPCIGGPELIASDEDLGIVIDQGKDNGANPGFRVSVKDKGRFMLKVDTAAEPERATAATSIAARFYYAAGYHAPCDSVVYLHPDKLKLKPGLTITDNTGVTKKLDAAKLKSMLADASRRGDRVRFVASRWLEGRPVGPYTYAGTKDDDPLDVVPHEDRRELRGGRIIAAWLNHFDSREQNSMAVWLGEKGDPRRGIVRHYIIDLGDCFGSRWDWDEITQRLGHAYYFDNPLFLEDFGSLGIVQRPWDRQRKGFADSLFFYFRADDFDVDAWRGGYPNPAFSRMTEHDGAWLARILAHIETPHIAEAVRIGDFTDPRQTRYLVDVLAERRRRILDRYLTRLSPVSEVKVTAPYELCMNDLAVSSGVAHHDALAPSATLTSAQRWAARAMPVRTGPGGTFCVAVPKLGGAPDDADPSRYHVLVVNDGIAKGALRIHYYERASGIQVVGLERPDP